MLVRYSIAVLLAAVAFLSPLRVAALGNHDVHGVGDKGATNASVDLRDSVRHYQVRSAMGWNVHLEEVLVTEQTNLVERVMKRLSAQLAQVRQLLPAHSMPALRRVPIYVLHGDEESARQYEHGAEYLAKDAPDHRENLDPEHGHSIVIYSARRLSEMSDFGVLKLLVHEFAHAWHLGNWSERYAPIVGAYEAAMTRELYRGVRRSDGTFMAEAYARKNQLEYFAELTCVWFCRNDHFPFERGDLKIYDAGGARLMEEMWMKPPTSGQRSRAYVYRSK